VEFRILGPLEVRHDGRPLALGGPRRRAILALLLLRANKPVPFDVIVDEVWGADTPSTAHAALQNQASALRRLLGADRLVTEGAAYRLHVEPGELDLDAFEHLVAEARYAEREVRAALLTEALSIWRGLPLVDFPAEPFAQDEVVRLEELRLSVVEERIEADLASGRAEALVPELEQLLPRHPLRERLWAFLMLALYNSGRQAEALSTYRRAHEALIEEIGIEPGPQLKELQRRILLQQPGLGANDAGSDPLLLDAAALLPVDDRDRAKSLLDYAVALRRLGEYPRAAAAVEEAERRAGALGDRVLLARASLIRSTIEAFEQGGLLVDHLRHAEHAATVFGEAGEDGELAGALREKGEMLRDLGRAAEAVSALESSLAAAVSAGDRWQESISRNLLATALAFGPTSVADGIAACEAHLAALDWGMPGPIGLWASLGELLAQIGRVDDGRQLLLEAQEACRQHKVLGSLTYCLQAHARMEVMMNNLDDAEMLLREACELLDSVDNRGGLCTARAELAYVIAQHTPEDAERLAQASRRLAASDDFSVQVGSRRALGCLKPAGGGLALLEEATALCAESDFLNLHAATLEDLANVRRAVGDGDGASAALHQALELYDRKGNIICSARVREALA
jgi:DNA-binding SARP family transcriptional activator